MNCNNRSKCDIIFIAIAVIVVALLSSKWVVRSSHSSSNFLRVFDTGKTSPTVAQERISSLESQAGGEFTSDAPTTADSQTADPTTGQPTFLFPTTWPSFSREPPTTETLAVESNTAEPIPTTLEPISDVQPKPSDSSTAKNITIPKNDEDNNVNTIPWSNVSTVGWKPGRFELGFRNQIMAFSTVMMQTSKRNWSQILLPTIRHTDTYGSELLIGFDELFDVSHWNSQYPLLPRMVDCDSTIFTNYDCENNTPKNANEPHPENPYFLDNQPYQFAKYKEYSVGAGKFSRPVFPNPIDLTITMGGLRPHPELQELIHTFMVSTLHDDDVSSYMTLHARIEPDMQVSSFCPEKKVLNLTDIFQFLEDSFPTPPVKYVFMPINRQLLEKEGTLRTTENVNATNSTNAINWMAVHNLKALNDAINFGLWNGTVKVFEFGANALQGTRYEQRASITGSVINFYLGIRGKIFVGSEVSSYALDILKHRFYRNMTTTNFKYLPNGLEDWTPPGTVQPPGFQCR